MTVGSALSMLEGSVESDAFPEHQLNTVPVLGRRLATSLTLR